jgi:hypothetical protein
VRDAYAFLQRQGAINFGLLRGDPRVQLPPDLAEQVEAAAAAGQGKAGGEDAAALSEVSAERLAEKLFEIMSVVDMNVSCVGFCLVGAVLLLTCCWHRCRYGRTCYVCFRCSVQIPCHAATPIRCSTPQRRCCGSRQVRSLAWTCRIARRRFEPW